MMVGIDRTLSDAASGWRSAEEVEFYPSLGGRQLKLAVTLEAVGLHFDSTNDSSTQEGGKRFRLNPENLSQAKIEVYFSAQSNGDEGKDGNEDAFLFHFIRSLEGVPITAFRQCKECWNWYLHLSKRDKRFCTNACASRYGARSRREKLKKNPAAYEEELEKNRERAHEAYVRKTKEKTSGKVQRRPRKRQ